MPEKIRKKMVKGKTSYDRDFFTLPHPVWMIIIAFSLWLLKVATITPENIPGYFGPLSTLAVYMGTQHPKVCLFLCVFAVVTHVLEAAYAGKLCHDRGMRTAATIKWTLSTFCWGFSSLIRLLPHKPPYKMV